MHFSGVQTQDLLGISLIVIGVALVCVGLVFLPRAPQNDPTALDGPDEFRTILDALDEDDRRDENRDFGEPPAKEQSTLRQAGSRSYSNAAPASVNFTKVPLPRSPIASPWR
jgi:hypothetical protein